MRYAVAVSLAAVLVPLASCSDPAQGTLSGQVTLYGGPPGRGGKQALNGQPGPDWKVTVSSGSQVIAQTTSDSSGHFTFRLAPGTYTLQCGSPRRVTFRAAVETTVPCAADVP